MKKSIKVMLSVFLAVILLFGTVIVLAAGENALVQEGEIFNKDLITIDSTIENNGVIKGDLIAFSQTILSNGVVEGDIIAGANKITVNGSVEGSVRIGGSNITIMSDIERNAMVFGTNVELKEGTFVKGNTYIFGQKVSLLGDVGGDIHIFGTDVTLSGNFRGDVYLHDMNEESKIDILSGTIIGGKLTYEGTSTFQVPDDVNTGDYQYIRVQGPDKSSLTTRNIMSYVKRFITLIVYYLFALLIYKMFPRFFKKSGNFISEKPSSAVGLGIATFGSLVGGGILLFILLLISLLILKASVLMFTGFVLLFITVLTLVFANIPVSLWLGSLLLKHRKSIPIRLAVGLGLITVIKLALEILRGIMGTSVLIGIISFLFNAAVWVLGTGALVRTIFNIFKSANIQAEIEEYAIEREELEFN